MGLYRCRWAGKNQLLLQYHDQEWGVPVFDDQRLFELLTLEIFQAGLTWSLILQRRPAFRKAFMNFNYHQISTFTAIDQQRLLNDPGIIRNHADITATIHNAQVIEAFNAKGQSFSKLLWGMVDYHHINGANFNSSQSRHQLITSYVNVLHNMGIKQIGPTTTNAFLQSSGIINDHELNCFRYRELM